ncbi:transposase family protein [Streptomyces netropsis]
MPPDLAALRGCRSLVHTPLSSPRAGLAQGRGEPRCLAAPDGTPLWVSDAEPGSAHDLAAARLHALPDLCQAARDGLPTLADTGYTGAGGGIHVPFREHPGLPVDTGISNQTCNTPPRPALHRRTRHGRTQTTLAHPPARHPQPQPDRSHHPSSTRPQSTPGDDP